MNHGGGASTRSTNHEATELVRRALPTLKGLSVILPEIMEVAEGFEGVYLVGGAVRDILVGAESLDIDLVVEGDGVAFAQSLADRAGINCVIHEEFGTAALSGDGIEIDIATSRRESYSDSGALPKVEPASLEEDLTRRDFTINALAASLKSEDFGLVIDPFDGYQDIRAGTVRVLHEVSFDDDPTRILRAVNYAARFGYSIDEASSALARKAMSSGLLDRSLSERVGYELLRVMALPQMRKAAELFSELGIESGFGPGLDCGGDTLKLIEQADDLASQLGGPDSRLSAMRLALFLRDRPHTTIDAWLDAIKVKKSIREVITRSLELAHHDELGQPDLKPSALYQLFSRRPPESLIAAAVVVGGQAPEYVSEWTRVHSRVSLLITGNDLIDAGFNESPQLGQALEQTLMAKLDGEVAGRKDELAQATSIAKSL